MIGGLAGAGRVETQSDPVVGECGVTLGDIRPNPPRLIIEAVKGEIDIAIVVGNKIRIRTDCSGQSNNKVLLCLTIYQIDRQVRYAARKKEGSRNYSSVCTIPFFAAGSRLGKLVPSARSNFPFPPGVSADTSCIPS